MASLFNRIYKLKMTAASTTSSIVTKSIAIAPITAQVVTSCNLIDNI